MPYAAEFQFIKRFHPKPGDVLRGGPGNRRIRGFPWGLNGATTSFSGDIMNDGIKPA